MADFADHTDDNARCFAWCAAQYDKL